MFFLFCVVFVAFGFIWAFLNASVAGKTTAVEILKGITTGLAQTVVVLTASSSHPRLSLAGLLAVAACLVFYVCWAFRISTFRMRQIITFALIVVILLTAMWATIEAIRFAPGVGPATIRAEMLLLFGRLATIVAVALVVARILSTFGRSTLVKVTIAFAAFLAIVALGFAIYGGLSNIRLKIPFSAKSVASAAKDEPEGNFILKWLKGLSGEETEVSEDESSVAEVDGESAVPDDDESEAKKKAEAEAKKKAEAEAEAKKKAEAEPDEGVVVKWDDYDGVVQKHPEFNIQNYPLTLDDIPENNAFFGPSIYNDGDTEQDVYKRVRKMVQHCPLIFAEMAAIVDQACKTDLCGSYYNGNDAEWASAINQMVEECFDTPGVFVNLDGRFLAHLDNEVVGLELRQMKQIKDQFYLDIYTRRGIPRLVVCETYQSGMVLIIWLRTKGPDPVNDVGIGVDTNCCNVCGVFKRDGSFTPVSEEMDITVEKVPEMPKGYDPPKPTKAPISTPKPEPTATPTPVPGEGGDPPAKKAPKEDAVNHDGGASTGGGDNTSDGGVDEEQHEDPRQEEVVAPAEVEPETPPVVEAYHEEPVVSYEEPVNYAPDPVTDRGAADGATAPTSEGGDGEFVPED